jgi:hypothetical protein
MTKIIIQLDNLKAEVTDEADRIMLPEILELIDQAIRGVGFVPPENAQLDYCSDGGTYDNDDDFIDKNVLPD